MVQLARRLTGLTVIGTASRPETADWVCGLGAHHVIDHTKPLADEFKRAKLPAPDYAVSLTHTEQHFSIADLIAPWWDSYLIDDPAPIRSRVHSRRAWGRLGADVHTVVIRHRLIEQHKPLTEAARPLMPATACHAR
jgi:hypothetical protein